MEAPVLNLDGETVDTIYLDDQVFGIEPHQAVLHQAVVAYRANARRGTADTLTRGEVVGGGRKLWRQKGTGRARQGSSRSPHWRGGGVAFGPHPRSYHQRLPRKMRRLALRSALASKLRDDGLVILDHLELQEGRTQEMARVVENLGVGGSALVVMGTPTETVKRASRNLPDVKVVSPGGMSLLEILRCRFLVLTRDAVSDVTKMLLPHAGPPKDTVGGSG